MKNLSRVSRDLHDDVTWPSVEACLFHFSSQLTQSAREAHFGHYAVAANASLNAKHHPDLGPHGHHSARHTPRHQATLAHLSGQLTRVAARTEQAANTDLAIVKAFEEAGAPVTVASGNHATLRPGHLGCNYRSVWFRHPVFLESLTRRKQSVPVSRCL